jgi:uncharacterized membrane protein
MNKGRLEAFSDGVIAILITIMVLDLHVPHGANLDALRPMLPGMLTYVLSFVFLGIYWNNHHHLLHATTRINGAVLWANLHLLFWLSLVPVVTGWMADTLSAPLPTAIYGAVLLAAGIAYTILLAAILRNEGPDSRLRSAVGRDFKGKISLLFYASAISLAFLNQWIADAIYVTVALIWFVPDRRIETMLNRQATDG